MEDFHTTVDKMLKNARSRLTSALYKIKTQKSQAQELQMIKYQKDHVRGRRPDYNRLTFQSSRRKHTHTHTHTEKKVMQHGNFGAMEDRTKKARQWRQLESVL